LIDADGPARRPAVILLHGSGGLRYSLERYQMMAEAFAAASGYAILVPHYFDRTDTTWADSAIYTRYFPTWMETVADGMTFAQSRPNVDPSRIALVGMSLGGYLAVSLGATDERVKAVVEFFGGIPDTIAATAKRMPPTLILHGDADTTVPVSEARKLESFLRERRAAYEIEIFPAQGHRFDPTTTADALRRTAAFLTKHLGE
jgi:carboxymethylenebutenolidase